MTTASATAGNFENNVHNLAAEMAEEAKASLFGKKPLGGFGYFLRAAALLLLFVAAIAAIAFGMHYGIAFVATLGLGESIVVALKVLITIVGYLAVGTIGWFTGGAFVNLYQRRAATKAAALTAAAKDAK